MDLEDITRKSKEIDRTGRAVTGAEKSLNRTIMSGVELGVTVMSVPRLFGIGMNRNERDYQRSQAQVINGETGVIDADTRNIQARAKNEVAHTAYERGLHVQGPGAGWGAGARDVTTNQRGANGRTYRVTEQEEEREPTVMNTEMVNALADKISGMKPEGKNEKKLDELAAEVVVMTGGKKGPDILLRRDVEVPIFSPDRDADGKQVQIGTATIPKGRYSPSKLLETMEDRLGAGKDVGEALDFALEQSGKKAAPAAKTEPKKDDKKAEAPKADAAPALTDDQKLADRMLNTVTMIKNPNIPAADRARAIDALAEAMKNNPKITLDADLTLAGSRDQQGKPIANDSVTIKGGERASKDVLEEIIKQRGGIEPDMRTALDASLQKHGVVAAAPAAAAPATQTTGAPATGAPATVNVAELPVEKLKELQQAMAKKGVPSGQKAGVDANSPVEQFDGKFKTVSNKGLEALAKDNKMEPNQVAAILLSKDDKAIAALKPGPESQKVAAEEASKAAARATAHAKEAPVAKPVAQAAAPEAQWVPRRMTAEQQAAHDAKQNPHRAEEGIRAAERAENKAVTAAVVRAHGGPHPEPVAVAQAPAAAEPPVQRVEVVGQRPKQQAATQAAAAAKPKDLALFSGGFNPTIENKDGMALTVAQIAQSVAKAPPAQAESHQPSSHGVPVAQGFTKGGGLKI